MWQNVEKVQGLRILLPCHDVAKLLQKLSKKTFIHIFCIGPLFDLTLCLCSALCRETRRLLERLVYVSSDDFPVTVVQVASWYLLRHLHAKNDQELLNGLLQHAKMNGNQRLLGFYTKLTSSASWIFIYIILHVMELADKQVSVKAKAPPIERPWMSLPNVRTYECKTWWI